ncbi:MFS transporter [Alicyclobacillus fructus]|uniref:MFS transporter n=1 Tax=Alicyclobacillus fructus TaxID=2816082 RepID=UPI001A8FE3A1|nr:MFS transporter [Alicyclobacillus fructus]
MDQQVTPFKRLFVGLILSGVGLWTAILTPILVLLTIKLQSISPQHLTQDFGTITGIGALFALVFNPLGGWLSDRTRLAFGRRRTWLLIGAIGLAASMLGIGLARSVLAVGVLWCLCQALFNISYAATTALVADQVPEEKRSTISGSFGMSIYAGELIGLQLVNMLSHGTAIMQWGSMAILAVISAVIGVVLIKEGKFTGVVQKAKGFSVWNIIPNPKKHASFAWAWLARFLVMIAATATTYNSVFLTQKFGYSTAELPEKVLLLTLISAGGTIVFSIIGGYLSDKVGKQKPFVIISGTVMSLGLIVMAFAHSFGVVELANAIMGIGTGTYMAVDLALVTRVLPNPEDTAKDLGVINIANALPQSLTPFFAPFLIAIGGYPFLYILLGVIGILGGLAVLPIPEIGSGKTPVSTFGDNGGNKAKIQNSGC